MEDFGNDVRRNRSEAARRRTWFIKNRQEKLRREELVDEAAHATLALAAMAVIATETQINDFKLRLERYDAAVTEAILENEQQLVVVQVRLKLIEKRIQNILNQAYVHEDGRRMFKSEDGTFVIDEFAQQVSRQEVDFDLIPNDVTAEEYLEQFEKRKEALEAEQGLVEERQQLHQAQELIREKEEALEIGKTTEQDLEDFDKEIFYALPQSARDYLPDDMNPVANAPDLKAEFLNPAAPADISINTLTTAPEINSLG